MFYYSQKSKRKVVHMESCHHIRNTPREDLIPIDTIDEVIHKRFRFCKNCNQLGQQFYKEEDALYAY